MKVKHSDVVEFYRQLAILTKSGLPLPESVRQLGLDCGKPVFKEALLDIAAKLERGEGLAAAMRGHEALFQPLHLKMLEAAEAGGALPEALAEIALLSRVNASIASMAGNIIVYPALTLSVSFIVFLAICHFVIPGFRVVFSELLEGAKLPFFTEFFLGVSGFVSGHIGYFVVLLAAHLGFCGWLFSGSFSAKRFLIHAVGGAPGSDVIFYNLDMARFCSLWALSVKRRMPDPHAFAMIADLLEVRRLSQAVRRAGLDIERGASLKDALGKEPDISCLLKFAVNQATEGSLAAELGSLSELFLERASFGYHRARTLWELAASTLMSVVVAFIIIALFAPLLSKLF